MYTYQNLKTTNFQTLYQTFQEAFSDYQIKINLSPEEFHTMLKRRGFNPENSIGAFKEPEHKLVGFILNGLRKWNGKPTSYDLGTGIIPAHRRQGLTRHMFQIALEVLAQNNVEQYLLEVLQDNKPAFEIYKKQGLSITRNYLFFKMDKCTYVQKKRPHHGIEFSIETKLRDWESLKRFWDFQPSWQNSIDSIHAVQDIFAYVIAHQGGNVIGYGIIDKQTGDIPQVGVSKHYRRTGVASGIITNLLKYTESDVVSVINVEDTYDGMTAFLSKSGFEQVGSQYEMLEDIEKMN